MEYVLDRLRLAGCSLEDAAPTYETLVAYVAGGSSLEAEPAITSNAALRRHLATLDAAAYPVTVDAAAHLFDDDDTAFRFGLDLFLDGVGGADRRDRQGRREGLTPAQIGAASRRFVPERFQDSTSNLSPNPQEQPRGWRPRHPDPVQHDRPGHPT